MNKQRPYRLLILLLLLFFSLLVLAQGNEQQGSATSQETEQIEASATSSSRTGEAGLKTQEAASESPAGDGSVVTPIKEFKPTEQIEADSAVSFPIDI